MAKNFMLSILPMGVPVLNDKLWNKPCIFCLLGLLARAGFSVIHFLQMFPHLGKSFSGQERSF